MTIRGTDPQWKQILLSIFIGAVVAFLTSFMEGLADMASGYGNNLVGGTASSFALLVSRIRI